MALSVSALTAAAGNFLDMLPPQSAVAPGYTTADSVRTRMAAMPLCPLEGLWRMAGDGALVAVESYCVPELPRSRQPSTFRMVMVKSPQRHIRPGTVIGHLVSTVRPGVYEARIYTAVAERTGLDIPGEFLLTLDDNGVRLTFSRRKVRVRLNLNVMLPYMFRSMVRVRRDPRPEGLDGAIKVFPASVGQSPQKPCYL